MAKTIFLICLSVGSLLGETYSVYYGKGQKLENCTLESINDTVIVVRKKPAMPRLVQEATIQVSELKGIRIRSRTENDAACFGMGGVLLGLSIVTSFIQPESESKYSGVWRYIEDAYFHLGVFAAGGVVGGAVAYYGSMLLMGHKTTYIQLDGLSSDEKVAILRNMQKN